GEVPAAPIEDLGEDSPRGVSSAPVELMTDPPSQMAPVNGGQAVTELDNIEISRGLANEPADLSSPVGARSTDQLSNSPASESSGIVTVAATFQGTLEDIRFMLALDLIDSKGIAKALSSNINAASNAAAGGDREGA